jgi:hypothetical protein
MWPLAANVSRLDSDLISLARAITGGLLTAPPAELSRTLSNSSHAIPKDSAMMGWIVTASSMAAAPSIAGYDGAFIQEYASVIPRRVLGRPKIGREEVS